jgi:citrate lyase synthetase
MAILYYRCFLGELLATWYTNNLITVDGGMYRGSDFYFPSMFVEGTGCVKSCYFVIDILFINPELFVQILFLSYLILNICS